MATIDEGSDVDLVAFSVADGLRIADAVRFIEGHRPSIPRQALPDRNFTYVPFKNVNAGTVPAYGVMRITGATIVDTFPYLTTDQPDSTYRWLYLVNGADPVATNAFGWGVWLHHADYALYDTGSGTPAYGDEWGPTASSWKLQKYAPGFWVMGGNNTSVSGSERTVCVQVPPAEVLVKNATGSAIAAAASGTFTLEGGTAGSEATLSMTLTAWNKSSVSFADTKFGAVGRMCGNNYAVPFQT